MPFFWRKSKEPDNIAIQFLIDTLETGNGAKLLWQPANKPIEYLPITSEMLLKYKKPEASLVRLSIHKTKSSRTYTLLILNTPWAIDELKFLPLIIETNTIKIVGIMLPFNELHGILPQKNNREISKLGMIWTEFAITKQFL